MKNIISLALVGALFACGVDSNTNKSPDNTVIQEQKPEPQTTTTQTTQDDQTNLPLLGRNHPDFNRHFQNLCEDKNNKDPEIKKTIEFYLDKFSEIKENRCEEVNELLFYSTMFTNLSTSEISTLEPFAGAIHIDFFAIQDSKISNIDFLKNYHSLKQLYLRSNKIEDISSLKHKHTIEYLSIGDNPVKDITPIKSLSNLKELDLSYLHKKPIGIEFVKEMKSIKILDLSGLTNKGIDVKQIYCDMDIEELKINGSEILNLIDFIDECDLPNLTKLNISGNSIKSLKGIEKLTKLEVLNITYTTTSDITPLFELKNLKLIIDDLMPVPIERNETNCPDRNDLPEAVLKFCGRI